MRALTPREKNLGVFTVVGSVLIGGWGIHSRLERRIFVQMEEAAAAREKIEQSRELLKVPEEPKMAQKEAPKVVTLEPPKRSSLFILHDLTLPKEAEKIKIQSTVKTGDHSFQLTVQGEFVELMHFLSFLERQEGKFSVSMASWTRAGGIEKSGRPSRDIVGVFQLNMKS